MAISRFWSWLCRIFHRKPSIPQPSQTTPQVELDLGAQRIPPLDPENILSYWATSLKNNDLTGLELTFPRISVAPERLGWPNFNITYRDIDRQAVETMWESKIQIADDPDEEEDTAEDATPSEVISPTGATLPEDRESGQKDGPPPFLEVMICLCRRTPASWRTYVSKNDLSAKPNLSVLFYIPARITAKNELAPPDNKSFPLFGRGFLEPQPEGFPFPSYGQYDVYRQALESFRWQDKFETFSQYWEAVAKLFRDVTKRAIDRVEWRYANEEHTETDISNEQSDERPNLVSVILPRVFGRATQALSNAYESLSPKELPAALSHILGQREKTTTAIFSQRELHNVRGRHLSIVDRGDPDATPEVFPLDKTQRLALHRFLQLEDDPGVIAVSGPPGTGKTDMLRAVISTQWVDAALHQKPCPIVIACGATNQSVENVMSAFSGASSTSKGQNPLRVRWLHEVNDYTMSAPARGKIKDHQHQYQILVEGRNKDKSLQYEGQGAALRPLWRPMLPDIALDFVHMIPELFQDHSPFNAPLITEKKSYQAVVKGEGKSWHRQIVESLKAAKKQNDEANGRSPAAQDQAMETMEQVAEFFRAKLEDVCASMATLRTELLGLPAQGIESACSHIEQILNSAPDQPGSGVAKKFALEAIKENNTQEYAECVERILDVTLRPMTFHLAGRYWEAKWIASLPFPRKKDDSKVDQGENEEPIRLQELRRAAMLAPCIVSTLHSAPRLLKDPEQGHLFGKIDLLIVDESGQAAPEIGAPVLAYGHRVMCVGDLKQLAPIAQVPPEEDKRILLDYCANSEAKAQSWIDRGADIATGSVMKLSSTGPSFAEAGRSGILLRTHYRCVRTIIGYCIELLYNQHDRDEDGIVLQYELVPKISDSTPTELSVIPEKPEDAKGQWPLPAMAFIQGGSPNDEPVQTDTWKNEGEAQNVVEWISTSGRQLAQWVKAAEGRQEGPDLAELVGVVTPFRGQVELIRQLVQKHLDPDDPYASDRGPLSKRLTVGTVHTLQGAERPVVLFSAVNKESKATRKSDPDLQKVFIDRDGGNLLNVAISRAKKSFILFGHTDLFFSPQAMDPDNDLPTAVLGRYMAGLQRAEADIWDAGAAAPSATGIKLSPLALAVVESPFKAKAIQGCLPDTIQVFGSGGHIRDLATLSSLTPEKNFEPLWKLSGNTDHTRSALVRTMCRLLQTRHLILATDPDPQGEAIAWHVIQVLKKHPWFSYVRTISRVTFTSIAEDEIRRAFANPVRTAHIDQGDQPEAALNMNLAHAAIGLRIIDGTVGAYYREKHGLSSGRVQAPLLRLLNNSVPVDESEKEEQRFLLDVNVRIDNQRIPAILVNLNSGQEVGFSTEQSADEAIQTLQSKLTQPGSRSGERIWSPLPFKEGLGTAEVLQRAWRYYGFAPSKTMQLLQALYEHRSTIGDTPEPESNYENESGLADEAHSSGLTRVVQGRLELTEQGRQKARELEQKEPYLSSPDFSRDVEASLDQVAEGELSYEDAIGLWAKVVFETPETTRVASPVGRTVDDEGREIFPEDLIAPDWDSKRFCIPNPLTELEGLLNTFGNRETLTEDLEISTSMSGPLAHPPLTPLSMHVTPDSPELRGILSEDAIKIYRIIWGRTMAVVLRPPEVKLQSTILLINGTSYGLRITSAYILKDGWFVADPDGRKAFLNMFAENEIFRSLLDGSIHGFVEIIGPPRRNGLIRNVRRPTPDHILELMQNMGLGRPSTYASHMSRLVPEVRMDHLS